MAGNPKRRKTSVGGDVLQELLHTGSISISGLASLLQKLKGVDLSQPPSEFRLKDINTSEFSRLCRTEQMPLKSGGTFDWKFLDPNKLLAAMVERQPVFHDHVAEAYRRYPCSPSRPWHLVIAFDEFAPGHTGSAEHSWVHTSDNAVSTCAAKPLALHI